MQEEKQEHVVTGSSPDDLLSKQLDGFNDPNNMNIDDLQAAINRANAPQHTSKTLVKLPEGSYLFGDRENGSTNEEINDDLTLFYEHFGKPSKPLPEFFTSVAFDQMRKDNDTFKLDEQYVFYYTIDEAVSSSVNGQRCLIEKIKTLIRAFALRIPNLSLQKLSSLASPCTSTTCVGAMNIPSSNRVVCDHCIDFYNKEDEKDAQQKKCDVCSRMGEQLATSDDKINRLNVLHIPFVYDILRWDKHLVCNNDDDGKSFSPKSKFECYIHRLQTYLEQEKFSTTCIFCQQQTTITNDHTDHAVNIVGIRDYNINERIMNAMTIRSSPDTADDDVDLLSSLENCFWYDAGNEKLYPCVIFKETLQNGNRSKARVYW